MAGGRARAKAALLAALLVLVVAGAWTQARPAAAAGAPTSSPKSSGVTLELFHGEGCPHCAAEKEFLAGLTAAHPELAVVLHEVWYDAANRELLRQTAERMGFEASGVPVTIVGDRVWIGFDDRVAAEVTATVEALGAGQAPPTAPAGAGATSTIQVPLVGAVDVSSMSLLASTLVIGFVDGINPCSLWVLSLLLAMVLNRGSRGRVALVGGVFLAVTAGMYALYIVGFYSALTFMSGMTWIRFGVAAIALAFGFLQLKDGLHPGAGPSLSISESARPGIYARMRGVSAPERRLATTLAATAALAVGVSLLETPCTAGLPLLWTSMLADQGVGLAAAAGLFAVYMAVFLLDELIVFGAAVFALRATRIQEHHGRALKIISGSFLATLGVTMLVAPDAMDSMLGSVVVMAAAALLAVVLWLTVRAASGRVRTKA